MGKIYFLGKQTDFYGRTIHGNKKVTTKNAVTFYLKYVETMCTSSLLIIQQ